MLYYSLSIGQDAERAEGKAEKADHKTKANANRLKSRIPQAVSSPPMRSNVHQTAPAPVKNPVVGVGANSRAGRATANNKTTSGIATAKSVTSPPRHNAPASRVAPVRSTSNLTKPINRSSPANGSSALLKSVKPGLAGSQQQPQLSKIPRPSQPSKSGPAAQLARPRHQASSPSSSMLPRTGVRGATRLKSPNRAHLTHANKGESASRSDLVSAR